MCESVFKTAGERHGMCESALIERSSHAVLLAAPSTSAGRETTGSAHGTP
jgi:hypothetical protein